MLIESRVLNVLFSSCTELTTKLFPSGMVRNYSLQRKYDGDTSRSGLLARGTTISRYSFVIPDCFSRDCTSSWNSVALRWPVIQVLIRIIILLLSTAAPTPACKFTRVQSKGVVEMVNRRRRANAAGILV